MRRSHFLPYRIEEVGNRTPSFLIPKAKRMKVLEFIQDHPQYILRKGDAKWEILGIPPPLKRGRENKHRTFISCMRKALVSSQHELSALSRMELQKHPAVKSLYERRFKHSSDPITPQSVMTAVRANILSSSEKTKPRSCSGSRPQHTTISYNCSACKPTVKRPVHAYSGRTKLRSCSGSKSQHTAISYNCSACKPIVKR